MANNKVIISGMIGEDNTYFADNPVIITVSNLDFPAASAIKVVRVQVLDSSEAVVGEFSGDVAGASPYSITFDISSALRSLWAEEDFSNEVDAAQSARAEGGQHEYQRGTKPYSLKVQTEYIDQTDGTIVTTQCHIEKDGQILYVIPAGKCIIGGRTEWERSQVTSDQNRAADSLQGDNPRNGDASTKPTSTPELVGSQSITSWVDLNGQGTKSVFFGAEVSTAQDSSECHAPIVMRDDVPYVDFLFVNRRGAVETCSAKTLEALDIAVETKQSTRIGIPSYKPTRTVTARATGGRRSWSMSSGYQTREWAEWWTLEFLMARRHWMRYPLPSIEGGAGGGSAFVPVTVVPAKKTTGIYDRTKQEMPSVEFTVTLALEG